MNSILRIRLQEADKYSNIPVSVDIFNEEFETVCQSLMFGTTDINLAPGLYIVRAYLPSGKVATSNTFVEEGKLQEVHLKPSQSPHEWAWWANFLGEAIYTEEALSLSSFPQTWLCLWQHNISASEKQEQWILIHPSEWVQKIYGDENFVICEIKKLPQRLHFFQLGSPIVPWRFFAVPPTQKEAVQVIIRTSQAPDRLNSGLVKVLNLETKVLTFDQKIEVLSHYLQFGLLEAASAVSAEVLRDAEKLSTEKTANLLSAVVGGYYLLQMGSHERIPDWCKKLDLQFPWLPDGAVIHAWQLLNKPEPISSDFTLARERLLEAVHRGLGIPIYKQGLRLLIDGLEMFAEEAKVQGKLDELVEKSLRYLRNYATVVDWSQPLTTFYGKQLTEPSLETQTGATKTMKQEDILITSKIPKQNLQNKVIRIEDINEILNRRNYELEVIDESIES